MSAAEIIEQIRALPREERARVAEFVVSELSTTQDQLLTMDRDAFDRAKKYVFENYGQLLSKLAK